MTGSHEIGAVPFWRRVWSASASSAYSPLLLYVVAANVGIQVISIFLRGTLGRPGSVAVIVGGALLLIGTLVVIARVRNPPPVIDFDDGVLRIGSDATPFGDVNEAIIVHDTQRKRDDLNLWFGGHRRRHTVVALRARRGALTETDRTVLAEMVALSGIQLPPPKPDPYDPKGKFAWLDQQWYATKEQVLDAILRTPETGDVAR